MNKKMKLLIKIGAWILALALAAVAANFILFHNADVLKIENGKITGSKPTWLTVHSDPADAKSPYYKLADIAAPRNYSADKTAEDLDGDPFTTQFVYKGKDTAKQPAHYTVQGARVTAEEISALIGESESAGWGHLNLSGKDVIVCPVFEGEEIAQVICLVPSLYEDLYIRIDMTLAEAAEQADWLKYCGDMVNKVTPSKQLHPFVADFKLNFLDEDRWEFLWDGLGVTLLITLFSTILGVMIGVVVAGVCSTWDKNGDRMHNGPGKWLLMAGNKLCRIFLTVIRGTPVVIQLMLFYFVILVSVQDWKFSLFGAQMVIKSGVVVAIIAFGINSGAYVAEIIRGGIMSIDQGQFEAGRSLGFNYVQTMWHIIIPQALKNVLPSLANEFIVLLKETSVSGYVAVQDLTKGGDIIKGVTYSPFLPLIAVAVIYLVLVMFFTKLVSKLERRLRNSDH